MRKYKIGERKKIRIKERKMKWNNINNSQSSCVQGTDTYTSTEFLLFDIESAKAKRLAISFSCFVLSIILFSMAVRSHWRSQSRGFLCKKKNGTRLDILHLKTIAKHFFLTRFWFSLVLSFRFKLHL